MAAKTRWMSKARLVKLCKASGACKAGVKALERTRGTDLGGIARAWFRSGAAKKDYLNWLGREVCIDSGYCCPFGCEYSPVPKGTELTKRFKTLNDAAVLKARERGV